MPQEEAALAVVLSSDNKSILLVKRRDLPVWVLPGGGVDPGEAPVDAAVREVWEESGYHVEAERCVAQYQPGLPGTIPTHLFLCRSIDGESRCSEESAAVEWFPIDQLPRPFFILHRYCLRDALKQTGTLFTPLAFRHFPRVITWALWHPVLTVRFLFGKAVH